MAEGIIVDQLTMSTVDSFTRVLEGVSLTVATGEIRGVVGESGCGKTAVAHALLGYARRGLRFDAGSVRIEGQDILGLPESERRALRGRRVTYVPQDPASALNPGLKIGTQMRLALGSGPASEFDRLCEALIGVKLEDPARILASYPHQLSGGQQQRVMLALAFAPRPALIVLDEPTTGLDVSTQRHVLGTIRELCGESGVTAVYVTHDLGVVKELADTITVMYAGEVIEDGPAAAVFGTPRHRYTVGLLRAAPVIGSTRPLRGIEGHQPRPGERGRGCLFAARCSGATDACREARPALIHLDERWVRCIHPAADWREGVVAPDDARETATLVPPGLLNVRGLAAGYGDVSVLSDVSLSVADGECLAIVGESGSGKTTLARCIVGLRPFTAGEVTLAGESLSPQINRRPRASLRRIQYVFQNPYASLNPRRTIGQSIGQTLTDFQKVSAADLRQRVSDALDAVALGARYADRFPGQMSGGERQRAAIARALIVEPDVLVCDEVTSALDVSVQAVIIQLLRALQRERDLALVFITHNMAVVGNIAQRLVVLRGGCIVEAGPVGEVLERPATEYTQQLVADIL